MTEHDAMFFVSGLREYLEGIGAGPGEGSWPPRELLAENLNANLNVLGVDATRSFAVHLGRLRSKRWVVVEACSPDCHAEHIKLTGAGLAALEWMNEHGCSAHQARGGRKGACHVGLQVRFKQKRAA